MSILYTNLNNLSLGANGADNATFTSSAISVGAITCTSISNSGINTMAVGAATASATITALPIAKSFYRMASTISVTLRGISAGADGQILELYFKPAGSQTLTIVPQATAAATTARIIIMTTAASLVTTGAGYASFIYSSTDSRWLCKFLST